MTPPPWRNWATQELHRGIGGYAAFASGFSFLSILTTVFAFFPLGFALWRARVLLHLAIVFICQFCVCLVFAELSGSSPRRRGDLPMVPTDWPAMRSAGSPGGSPDRLHRVVAAQAIAMQTVLHRSGAASSWWATTWILVGRRRDQRHHPGQHHDHPGAPSSARPAFGSWPASRSPG